MKKLIIFGGGHISVPLTEMAVILGYRVIVVDDREEFANQVRFPGAGKTICGEFAQVLQSELLVGEIDCATHIVIITRGHRQDKTCVQYLAGTDAAYIGMIGSRNKVMQTFRTLLEDSGALNRNRKKWPKSGDTTNLSYIEEFVNFRIPHLDAYIASLTEE
jgi:xanthine dehydrogenase accessory factor